MVRITIHYNLKFPDNASQLHFNFRGKANLRFPCKVEDQFNNAWVLFGPLEHLEDRKWASLARRVSPFTYCPISVDEISPFILAISAPDSDERPMPGHLITLRHPKYFGLHKVVNSCSFSGKLEIGLQLPAVVTYSSSDAPVAPTRDARAEPRDTSDGLEFAALALEAAIQRAKEALAAIRRMSGNR